MYDIKIDDSFFNDGYINLIPQSDIGEEILIEDSLTAQQNTLLWNDDKYLRIAPGEKNVPHSLLFEEHAEELSFPTIYWSIRRIQGRIARDTIYDVHM